MNEMDTIVIWVYLMGFSLPLLGSVVVLVRCIGFLMIDSGGSGGAPSLIKTKPLQTILVSLAFAFLILLALALVVFFVFKFAISRYSLPLPVDVAGIFLFVLYISGCGVFFYNIAGRLGKNSASGSSLSRCLADMVTEKVMGKASPGY